MSYSTLTTVNPGDVISTTWGNQVRDNFTAGPNGVVTTKGDLTPATGAGTLARLAVGADGTIYQADSTQTTGTKWASLPPLAPGNTIITGVIVAASAWTAVNGLAWSPNGLYLAVAVDTTPYLYVYTFDPAKGFTAISTLGVALAGAPQSVAWSPDGAYVGVAHTTSPYASVIPCTAGVLGTKVANPAALPAGNAFAIAWNPAGTAIVVGSGTTPFLQMWPWSAGAWGAKATDLSGGNIPTLTEVDYICWSPTGASIAAAGPNGVAIAALQGWAVSGAAWGAKFAAPASVPTNLTPNGLSMNAAGTYIVLAMNDNTNTLYMWAYTDTAFGAKAAAHVPLNSTSMNALAPNWWEQGTTAMIIGQGYATGAGSNYMVALSVSAGVGAGVRAINLPVTNASSQKMNHMAINPVYKHIAYKMGTSPFFAVTIPAVAV